MEVSYSPSGRATGEVSNFEALLSKLVQLRPDYDAIGISSIIDVPAGYHQRYFDSAGAMVNPWGGVATAGRTAIPLQAPAATLATSRVVLFFRRNMASLP